MSARGARREFEPIFVRHGIRAREMYAMGDSEFRAMLNQILEPGLARAAKSPADGLPPLVVAPAASKPAAGARPRAARPRAAHAKPRAPSMDPPRRSFHRVGAIGDTGAFLDSLQERGREKRREAATKRVAALEELQREIAGPPGRIAGEAPGERQSPGRSGE
jgi:hypothetical protein